MVEEDRESTKLEKQEDVPSLGLSQSSSREHQLVNWRAFQKVSVDSLDGLERSPHVLKPMQKSKSWNRKRAAPSVPEKETDFKITRARNLDNIPEKA